MSRRHVLENRVPPPLVGLIIGAAMVGAARATPALSLQTPVLVFLGVVLGVLGFACSLLGVASFERQRTTVNPLKPLTASSLVDSGIFIRTRNPMYLGMTMVLLGAGIGLANPISAALVALFPLYIGRFQIEPEERAMAELFGDAFTRYKARVPRWF